MSEPVQLAKTAREQLAAALNALQCGTAVPPEIEDLAEPIAEAMGILHRIERSGGQNLDGHDVALGHVRDALNHLQALTVDHPLVDTVTEAVATSLGKLHALKRAAKQPAAAPAPQAQPAPAPAPQPVAVAPAPQYQPAPAPQPVAVAPAPQYQPAPQPGAVLPAPQPVAVAPALQPAPQRAPAPQPDAVAPTPQPAPQPAPAAARAPAPAAAPAPAPAPARAPAPAPAAAPAPAPAPAPATQPRASQPSGAIDVELGTHSASNFYKGLGGNDVVEHGGIFVATYKIPKIGSIVSLRVLLPGDYEFHASAMVQWTREPVGSGDSAEPGFGARFTQIAPEGRQLVYRYTRNREPIFYDDL